MQPGEFDILLPPGSAEGWVYKRDASAAMSMRDALWERDGIRYLRSEIQLLYKAKGLELRSVPGKPGVYLAEANRP